MTRSDTVVFKLCLLTADERDKLEQVIGMARKAEVDSPLHKLANSDDVSYIVRKLGSMESLIYRLPEPQFLKPTGGS